MEGRKHKKKKEGKKNRKKGRKNKGIMNERRNE